MKNQTFMAIAKQAAHLGVENAYLEDRLRKIAIIIENVDQRCTAADGPVSNTRIEMTDDEMRQIYRLSKFTRWHKITDLTGYEIHHKDGNPRNHEITNIELRRKPNAR
jgi:hypothetical protein